MKVLFWVERFWPCVGGIEVLTARLVPALRDRGHDITVITSLEEGRDLLAFEHYRGVPIHRLPFRAALSSGSIDRFREVKREVARLKAMLRPDVIHLNAMGPSVVFHLETMSTLAAPMVFTLHSHPAAGVDARGTAVGKLLGSAAWVTAVSSATLAEARTAMPAIAARSSVIYNGVVPPAIAASALQFDPPRLLCLGRLVLEKGFDIALRTLAALIPRWPAARLIVAGDGPARAELAQYAAELQLGHAVEFTGWVPPQQVASLVNTAAIVLMPSRREGLPLVALEAALMARPVVATRVGGLPEVILDGETGLLVDPDGGAAFTHAVDALLADPQRATRMGQAGRTRATEVFGWERCVAAYDTLYRTLPAAPARDVLTPAASFANGQDASRS
jgi:glycogen synthase